MTDDTTNDYSELDEVERKALAYSFLIGGLKSFVMTVDELPLEIQSTALRLFERAMRNEIERFIETGDASRLNDSEMFARIGSFDIQMELSNNPNLLASLQREDVSVESNTSATRENESGSRSPVALLLVFLFGALLGALVG